MRDIQEKKRVEILIWQNEKFSLSFEKNLQIM